MHRQCIFDMTESSRPFRNTAFHDCWPPPPTQVCKRCSRLQSLTDWVHRTAHEFLVFTQRRRAGQGVDPPLGSPILQARFTTDSSRSR